MLSREYNEKERAWLWLSRVIGPNVKLASALLGTLEPWELRRGVLAGEPIKKLRNLKEENAQLLKTSAEEASVQRYVDWLNRHGIRAVTKDSADYPELLKNIYDPPMVLYAVGRLRADTELPIAVIGSRKCSDYGISMAEFFGREIAAYGGCVISGLALGCDSAAARGALEAEGNDCPTVAVLGSGVNVIYPRQNKKLYCEIAERGAVVSEMLPNQPPNKLSFPMRNRIISGLSRGVLVVEAGEKSGTSITAASALEQGRDVFAVPGRITDRMSSGTNGMIQRGEAKAVFDVGDILSEYGILLDEKAASPVKNIEVSGLPEEQAKIVELLSSGEKNVDELCILTGLDVAELNMHLTEMELSGIIKQLSLKVYSI